MPENMQKFQRKLDLVKQQTRAPAVDSQAPALKFCISNPHASSVMPGSRTASRAHYNALFANR
jgi:hypothetical protein